MLGMKPKSEITHTPSQPARRAVDLEEAIISSDVLVLYLYSSGELEDGRRRANYPILVNDYTYY